MEFHASYCYGPEERYNAGRGLHCLGLSEADANRIFQTFANRKESYALEILKDGVVIRKHGPRQWLRQLPACMQPTGAERKKHETQNQTQAGNED